MLSVECFKRRSDCIYWKISLEKRCIYENRDYNLGIIDGKEFVRI